MPDTPCPRLRSCTRLFAPTGYPVRHRQHSRLHFGGDCVSTTYCSPAAASATTCGMNVDAFGPQSAASPSLLANTATTARSATALLRERRRKRAFQRAMSGLARHPNEWWRYAFITLTSSPSSPPDIQRSWRMLHERMRRRGLAGRYIRVVERGSETGMVHVHLVAEVLWLDREWLSRQWEEIHNAPVVFVRRAYRTGRKGWSAGLALELGWYLAKATINRMSYSHSWAWRGLAESWARWKRATRMAGIFWPVVLARWQSCCLKARPPAEDMAAMWTLRHSPPAVALLRWGATSGRGYTSWLPGRSAPTTRRSGTSPTTAVQLTLRIGPSIS